MSFYSRGYGRYGALPATTADGLSGSPDGDMAGRVISAVLANGNLQSQRVLAEQAQTEAQQYLSNPLSNGLASTINGLEVKLAAKWEQLRLRALDRAPSLVMLASGGFGTGSRGQWMIGPTSGAIAEAALGPIIQDIGDKMAPEVAAIYKEYADSVYVAINTVKKAVQAAINLHTATDTHATATQEVLAAGDNTTAFVANVKLQTAVNTLKVATTQAKVLATAAQKATTAGVSPLVIAAVAMPLVGLIAYAMLRKKKSSVAGYRRRRSRR